MKVGIEQFKGKKLIDNTHPIAIRITHNGKTKYKFIGISCKAQHWDKNKKRITCRANDFRALNEIIQACYLKVCERAKWFEEHDYNIDLEYILSDKNLNAYNVSESEALFNDFNPNLFTHIIKARIQSYTKIKTQENYKAFLNVMIKLYGEDLKTNKINQVFITDFRNRIDSEGYSANHKNSLIKCFTSCYKYACANGWINNPMLISIKKFAHTTINRDITNADFSAIINLYKKDIGFNIDEYKGYKALCLFALDIMFQGLAPYDLAKIKIGDIKLKTILKKDVDVELLNNSQDYKNKIEQEQEQREVIIINTYRQKTERYVPICCDYSTARHLLYYFCKGKTKNDYLIDCFNASKTYNEKQLHNRCGVYFMNNANELNTYLKSHSEIINHTISNRVTYYIARHAFINHLDEIGTKHPLIRKMIGHKDNTLEKSYINKPTEWEQADLIYKIFSKDETIEDRQIAMFGEIVCNEQWEKLNSFLKGDIEQF